MKTEQVTRTRNYQRFFGLLKQMPHVDKESLVAQFTDDRTESLRDMTDIEYNAMIMGMQAKVQADKGRFSEYDTWRKRVIKAIVVMHELNGIHANDKVAHAKGTALKNMGFADDTIKDLGANLLFNQIKLLDLQTIYNWAIRRQKLIENGNTNLAKESGELSIMN